MQDKIKDYASEYGTPDEKLIHEAQDRFKKCMAWESLARKNWLEDYKFVNADAVNGYQWPNELRKNRDIDARPCLTINKTRQHCLQIINDAKQNKPGVAVRPTGNGATYEAAQMWEGMMRHIEYISNASTAYDTATTFQVYSGLGYLRVVTDYMDPTSFDQEIYIRRVDDPLSVYLDPDAKEADKSDAKFAFVFDDLDKEVFDKKYPKYKDIGSASALGDDQGWISDNRVRIAEYFRITEKKDILFSLTDPQTGEASTMLASRLPKEIVDELKADQDIKRRKTVKKEIEWYLIIGQEVAERKIWPGKYIPIIAVIGEETVIEGLMDRKGHVRAMQDPQRMYNYWTSSAVEFVALQGKSPWVASAESIEGFEVLWNNANRINHSVLVYNGLNDAGEQIAPPQRPSPPQMAPAYLQGMQIAGQELMMVSGQYESQMGESSNERSGKAIEERQRQGENATYHYIDNLAISIRFLGKILLDLIPKIYDVPRAIMIMAEDGTDLEVQLNPGAAQAYKENMDENNRVAQRIFNPNVGQYEVQADIGPAYATKREQAFEALMQIMTQAPATTSLIGDILFKSADFPMADEAAMRLRRMVPPQALGQGPTQQEQMLQQQLQQLTEGYKKLMEEYAATKLRLHAATGDNTVDQYNAETAREKVFLDHGLAVAGIEQDAVELADKLRQTELAVATEAAPEAGSGESPGSPGNPHAKAMLGGAPVPGAVRAGDGHWYLEDKSRKGKYLMVG